MTSSSRLASALALTLLSGAAAFAAPGPKKAAWWNDQWSHRRTLTPGDRTSGSGPFEFVVAEVPTLGRVKPDGSDLRLLGPDGKHVPLEVLSSGFEDRCLVAWKGQPRTSYDLYFGNAGATAPRRETVTAGLVLEVRELGTGSIDSWTSVRKLLESSPRTLGRWMWTHPQTGFNPFGPGRDAAYVFTGWLRVPADGVYKLATNSADASFALVDSKLVCEWPGSHGLTRRPTYPGCVGSVELKAGLHHLEYVNAFRKVGACALSFARPGSNDLVPLGPEALAGWRHAKVGPAETRDGPVPDFEWTYESDLAYEARPVTAMRFVPLTQGTSFSWDFGDGQTSSETSPVHVFLDEATFEVRLSVDGNAVSQRLRVRPMVGHRGQAYEKGIADYARIVKGYRLEGLSPAACFELGQVCHEARELDAATRAFRSALERGGIPLQGEDARWAERLFELYRDAGKTDDALRVCDVVAASPAGGPAVAARALALKGELLYDVRNQPDAAAACFRTVLQKYRRAPTDHVRWAFIRQGELSLARGDRDGARTILEEAETSSEWKKPQGDFEVSEGAHSINFEELLRQGEFEGAAREILAWEWERPTVLLSGLTRHLRGRMLLAQKKPERALLELERGLARDPRGAFADEALFLEGQALAALGKRDEARAAWEKLVRDFPESELVAQAKEKLK